MAADRGTSAGPVPGHGRKGHVKLLAVAVAGRGLVDPDEPVFGAGDEALLRGRAAFETTRVYGGRPFCLPEPHRAARGVGGQPRARRRPTAPRRERLAATALEAAARARRRPPPLLDGDDARRHGRRDPARARGAPRARHAARLAAARRRARAARLAAARASSRRATPSTWPARPRPAAAAPTTRVFLANGDIVLEAPISNVWWRRGDTLCTPSLEVGVLAGVTRATLLELAPAGRLPRRGRRVHRSTQLARRRRGVHVVVDPRGRSRWSSSTAGRSATGTPGEAAQALQAALRARATVRLADPPNRG